MSASLWSVQELRGLLFVKYVPERATSTTYLAQLEQCFRSTFLAKATHIKQWAPLPYVRISISVLSKSDR